MTYSEEKAARTGVADYFAVLGVGDRLRWKHRQKQQEEGTAMEEEEEEEEEEEKDHQQRFEREILDVDIFVTDSDESFLTATPSQDPSVDDSSRVQRSVSNATIPPSPSHSEATTSFTASSNAPIFSPSPHRTDDGWVVLEKTLLSATPVHAALDTRIPKGPIVWKKGTVWDANLDFVSGLSSYVSERLMGSPTQPKRNKPLTGLRRKVESTLNQFKHLTSIPITRPMETNDSHRFYLAYRRRRQSNWNRHSVDTRPAIADVKLCYIRIHSSTRPTNALGASRLGGLAGQVLERYQSQAKFPPTDKDLQLVNVRDYIVLPDGFEEWVIPQEYQWIRDPHSIAATPKSSTAVFFASRHRTNADDQSVSSSGTPTSGSGFEVVTSMDDSSGGNGSDPTFLFPQVLKGDQVRGDDRHCFYVPALAIRRQRTGDEERYHEDAAIVDLAVTFLDQNGPVMPHDSEDEDEEDGTFQPLGKSDWLPVGQNAGDTTSKSLLDDSLHKPGLGSITLLARKNIAFGFADVAFATRVLGRFPPQNYKNLPLPEEELPMFCYPTGCRLHRAKLSDEPVPQYYGFVVKNERGDSIYVSCVSFMEPLTPEKKSQLDEMSSKRAVYSLSHKQFCEERGMSLRKDKATRSHSRTLQSNLLLTSFDDMITFENKTICLVSRFPFWTAFRKFLLNMHLLAGTASDLPLERLISHLLLSVPLPRPGGPSVVVPLTALSEPMILCRPPGKDFPVVDLPYHRLFACLEIKTVAMIVLSLLALERKLIVMSTRSSLVLDVCELLKSLLFPFELCAPYVPRLTEPFKSSLDFPGAIFVGIHDDGESHGLAAKIRTTCPEESIVVNLDTGEILCDGDRYDVLTKAWDVIPAVPRSALVSELEALCRDAGIADGQEPLDSQYDESFGVSLRYPVVDAEVSTSATREPLDDRAVRDTFLRFFCAVLGGYERYLVVPDADFLVSGNEWFDAKGYLASVPHDFAPYLTCLVSTQLFQSFVQKRTEASDIHCLLFDESLAEYHASAVPYGRLGGDAELCESSSGPPQMLYSLLVDQSAVLSHTIDSFSTGKSFDASDGDLYLNLSKGSHDMSTIHLSELAMNQEGDLITLPCRDGLPHGKQYIYCVEGNACFPHKFDAELFLPREPDSYFVEISKATSPLLARSERELEEANRRRRLATSQHGYQAQRRCLWQLPKLMGSHLLGSWLLCIPTLVSQEHLSHEQRSRYLLRALGALRLLRSKQRIVPDEAAYRALMVACGRNRSDRRVELVKLFGLLRSDGIFPSAVTLGQYTKALAEGYSKRSINNEKEDDFLGVEVTESGSKIGRVSFGTQEHRATLDIEALDRTLLHLEDHGRRWRQRGTAENPKSSNDEADKRKQSGGRSWLPVNYSTSFAPLSNSRELEDDGEFRFVALWSRTRGCTNCSYIPLEEEVQAGWDIVGGEDEIPGSIACPQCRTMLLPMLGYKEITFAQAKQLETPINQPSPPYIADFQDIPPQLSPSVQSHHDDDGVSYVAYISPATLRLSLENYIEDHGEDVLHRERIPITAEGDSSKIHYCAVAAWDRAVAERGCWSAAKVLAPFLSDSTAHKQSPEHNELTSEFDESQLLSRFNLQGYYSSVWDHPDLSRILVALVEACDKRDFRPVVDAVVQCNQRRHHEYDRVGNVSLVESDDYEGAEVAPASDASALSLTVELDLYRTVLYLAKYQCATAFHTFFPATMKSCKGYHYWCAIGTPLPMFDRLLRDGVQRFNSMNGNKPIKDFHTPSEVALGFRCVFGHLV
ncbi:hypothetical protein FisN_2Lh192 [Fistulifera solaris]|uniref:UDENN domain-containing protein n=1 Tax=Fistulifera solaris TaxID=1519565 RepID=A0A1Z5KFC0_FISSO|nr:hypothetical protein FisN_2Lh192 [Fistulifera solaris]|eukprot:GAX24917.1 hypothetical protein FisN_2Lh192 [Fistulifera solaris]